MKTRNFSLSIGTISLLLLFFNAIGFLASSAYGQVAEWTFENISSAIPNLPIAASTQIPQVTATASISGGSNNGSPDACSGNETWSSNFWPTGNSRSTGEYLEFSVSANPGESIDITNFSFSSSASSSSSALHFDVYYSKNNFTTSTFLFSGSHSVNSCSSQGGSLNTTILPGSRIKFRIYPYGQNVAAQAATIRLDNVRISGALLPVQLASFSGSRQEDQILLKWTTETEIDNDYFAIERSWDGISFVEIGRVPGFGYSQRTQSYQFLDRTNQSGIHYYRLRQVDFDGTDTIYPLIAIMMPENNQNAIQIWPTIVQENLNIRMTTEADRWIRIRNVNGSLVRQLKYSGKTSFHQLDLTDLPRGWYVLQYFSVNQKKNIRFVKQ